MAGSTNAYELELGRRRTTAIKALERAASAARAAVGVASLYADWVSQAAEKRLGIDAGDERRLDDPDYDAALQWFSHFALVERMAEQALLDVRRESAPAARPLVEVSNGG